MDFLVEIDSFSEGQRNHYFVKEILQESPKRTLFEKKSKILKPH